MELADRNGCRRHRDIAASLRQSYYLESAGSCGERILPLHRTGVQSDKRQYKCSRNTLRQLRLVITIAMLDSDTGELEEKTLEHEGETVREFYSALSGPIDLTGDFKVIVTTRFVSATESVAC